MSDEPSFETDLLIAGCLNVTQVTGVPAPYLIAHALLFATAVVGGMACYKTHVDQVPQLIGTPTTLLSLDHRCPYWFAAAIGGAIDLQERISSQGKIKLPLGLTPEQVKMAKRLVKAHAPLRHIMPSSLQDAMVHGLPSMKPVSFQFLHNVRNGSVRKGPPLSAYGPHLLAYAEGEACYRDLLGKRLRPNSLYRLASNPSAEARVTIHGWAEFGPMTDLLRKRGMELIPGFGFLMDVPELSEQPFPVTDPSSLYLRFFNQILQLRVDYPKVFLPEPEVIGILDAEVRAQADRFSIGGVEKDVVNPRPMLPWNIATVLWAIERNTRSEPEKISELAKKACRIARFIHELHVYTLRRIYPTPKNGTTDMVDAAIVDILSVGPLKLRELMRKIHRSKAENLKIRLGFLEQNGVIELKAAEERGEAGVKWRTRAFPVENFANIAVRLSAKDKKAVGVEHS